MKDPRTDSELNIIIARWMGWENCSPTHGDETRFKGTPSETTVRVPFPNYCSDLNVIHRAILDLDVTGRIRFNSALASRFERGSFCLHNTINAEARDRAEALVAVIEA